MKDGMSTLDLFAVIKELQILKDSRINKIFQTSPARLKIQVWKKEIGKKDLIVEAGKRIHLTEFYEPSPKKPSTFAMTLRKYITNGIIKEIRQINFDRIVELQIEKKSRFYLIGELFGKGNVALTDGERKILAIMRPEKYKDRELFIGAKYTYPPLKENPFDAREEEILKAVNSSELNLVKSIAISFGLGGLYAEEICHISGIPKDKQGISEREASTIRKSFEKIKESIDGGMIIFEKGKATDVVPVMLHKYSEKKMKKFESFSDALDEYFIAYEMENLKQAKKEQLEKKISKLKKRLKEQELCLEKFKKDSEEFGTIGDLIYQNFKILDRLLKTISDAKKTSSWDEILDMVEKGKIPNAKLIKKIIPAQGNLILEIKNREIVLDIRKNLVENAKFYYEKSKKARKKISGAKDAIKKTEQEITEIEKKGIKIEKPRKKEVKKKEWYQKFRWFNSSDGFLVIGGKDATTNEILVKKYMEKGDIFVHADIHGAPVVLIKAKGKEVPEKTIQEAFDFAAAYSKAWKHGIFALDVYWVTPEQVSKTTKHGEYLAKGAFVIKGKRNYGKGRVMLGIGIKESKVIGGPISAVQNSDFWVKIVPGKKKSKEIAEEIKKIWNMELKVEDIQEFIPSGRGEIANFHLKHRKPS
jgi:predicted ribosome quality control (RQC) complex YloA/Tae2 family protein